MSERLGYSVAGCHEYDGSYVYGAPGANLVAFVSVDGGEELFSPPFATSNGWYSLCGFSAGVGGRGVIAGTQTQFFTFPIPTPTPLQVSAMAQSDVSFGPALIASATDGKLYERRSANPSSLSLWNNNFGTGLALAFMPGNATQFAVTLPSSVKVFSLNGGMPQEVWVRNNLASPPSSVAFGNFHPAPGPEVAVKQGTQIHIFSTDAGPTSPPVMVLVFSPGGSGSPGMFGSSLATEPNDAGDGLNALWVGSPGQDRVYRFLGDAGDVYEGPTTTAFGTAMGFSRRDRLIVGAPTHRWRWNARWGSPAAAKPTPASTPATPGSASAASSVT
jgi:hypothetical protein